LTEGRRVVVLGDDEKATDGYLVLAAETVTNEWMAFLVQHTAGFVCTALPAADFRRLRLPRMHEDDADAVAAHRVTVDPTTGIGTGISARDRARTVGLLAEPSTAPSDLSRPGHVVTLAVDDGGVLVRPDHAEGSMPGGARVSDFAREHDLPMLAIADLVSYRQATERLVEQVATSNMPTAFGTLRAVAYRSTLDDTEHLALVMGDVAEAGRSDRGALVRVHSECLTGDILGSLRCDCGGQLEQALRAITLEGCGAVVYLRGHEGRGIGLAHNATCGPSVSGWATTWRSAAPRTNARADRKRRPQSLSGR
jgi:3,4-dihydroxy 2-butanone 4-phosphate synthase/GTP cyclohydrolase II